MPRVVGRERHENTKDAPPCRRGGFTDGVAPLVAAGQLGDLLAQFPYSFKINPPALDHLRRLAGEFAHRDVPINVEFQHTSWYDLDCTLEVLIPDYRECRNGLGRENTLPESRRANVNPGYPAVHRQ